MENGKLRICSFYVSDWHLTAMLLPFIQERVKSGDNINTIFEKDIESNMKEILTRLQIDSKTKEKILNIDWKSKSFIKYDDVKNYLNQVIKNKGETIILVEGNKERIEYINKNIDRWIEKQSRKLKNKSVKIINCYEVTEFNENLKGILNMHDKILNTSGVHNIEELYSGYIKEEA